MKVLIDAGHGIDTPGKRSPDGKFREYLWNRQIADLVIARLVARGIDASLVVTETNDLSLSTRVQRVNRICNQVGAANVIIVSIHANAAGDGSKWMSAQGWSCYTSKGNTRSDVIAEHLYDAFEKEFPEKKIRKDMSDGDRDWEENFNVLQKSKCPAVLIENFFYDNQEECAWMMLRTTMERIANAIVNGLMNYLSEP